MTDNINNPDDACAACGKLRSALPVEVIKPEADKDPIEVQRFALRDEQRGLWVCSEDLDLFNEVEPLANQYPALRDLPELLESLQAQIEELSDRGQTLYAAMIA